MPHSIGTPSGKSTDGQLCGAIVACMTPGALAQHISDTTCIKANTVLERSKLLRAASPPLLAKNGRGPRAAAHMSGSDATNLLLANILDCERGGDLPTLVRHVRELPLAERMALPNRSFIVGLVCFAAETAGAAIDGLLDDIRSGRMFVWAAGETPEIFATIDARGESVHMSLNLPRRDPLEVRMASQTFGPNYDRNQMCSRQATLSGSWFFKTAAALGPPPS